MIHVLCMVNLNMHFARPRLRRIVMIVHRFMSALEFRKLMSGDVLENNSTHDLNKTSSVGFCFFTEPPHEAIHWLGGCVDADYCVTMDIPKRMLTQAKAMYRDPKKHDPRRPYNSSTMSMVKTEWCCRKYSMNDVRVMNATTEFHVYSELRQIIMKLGRM